MGSVLFTFQPLDDFDGDIDRPLLPVADGEPGPLTTTRILKDGIVEEIMLFRDPETLDTYLDRRDDKSI